MPLLTIRQKTNSLFVIAILLIALVTLANFLHFNRFRNSAQDVIHTQNVLRGLVGLYSGIQDAETGQRGYLLTGNSSYLVPFQQGKLATAHYLETVSQLIDKNSQQQEALNRIKIRTGEKFAELEFTINLQRNHHPGRAQNIVLSNSGEILMNEIRREISGMEDRERAIFEQRQNNLDNQTVQRMWILFTGSGLSLALLLWMFYLLTHEIEERRKSQEALQRAKIQLTTQTIELTASNKELEAFCYSVSHDLRAPLRGIAGFSQLLGEKYAGLMDAEGRGYLERVQKGVQRMSQLIDDLLNLSRITRSALILAPLDLAALSREVAQDIQSADPSHRTVEWVISKTLPAQGDAQLLRTVFENLLGNAWKFSSRRAIARIEIGAEEQKGETVYVVRDNGAGFDMAYEKKLFNAFQRLHTTAEFAGTGIGLATVHRIIQRHGGRIWAQGLVDQGAAFYFTLRRHHDR
jgi:signal transduction histidine kinase